MDVMEGSDARDRTIILITSVQPYKSKWIFEMSFQSYIIYVSLWFKYCSGQAVEIVFTEDRKSLSADATETV
jgi:hypothetical protein